LEPVDATPALIAMSEDGRRVFFATSAQLVAQDTNANTPEEEKLSNIGRAADVYEWEANGTEEQPSVFCRAATGCTHLISSGDAVGPSRFLGASLDGRDVFFATSAQLAPQATPEFINIYDARIDGGFAPPTPQSECTACQGVGSPPPLFSSGASGSFVGAGNAATPPVTPVATPKAKPVRCKRGYVRKKGRCVKVRAKKRRAKR
jgi:hypothetical protein